VIERNADEARRTYPFLTERARELGADADDCVSSDAKATGVNIETPAPIAATELSPRLRDCGTLARGPTST
jgi:hypothetical protein